MKGECHHIRHPKIGVGCGFGPHNSRGEVEKTLTHSFILFTGLQCPIPGKRYIVSCYQVTPSLGRKKVRGTP